MSEIYIKISSNKNKKKKIIFSGAPVGVQPKKGGFILTSAALVKKNATNPRPRLHVKRGDTVMVISGKDKGKNGKVLAALPKEGKIIIEGVNMIKKHQKAKGIGQAGEIIEKEAPIFASKVMLYDSAKKKPTRIGHKFLKDGKKVRIARTSGEQID